MENKIKFVIIGLAGLLVIFFFIILAVNSSKQGIERERNALQTEVGSLRKQNESISQQINYLQSQKSSLQRDLDRVNQERTDLQAKYDLLLRERDVLVEKIKSKPGVEPAEKEIEKVRPPQTDDAYWAGILKEKKDLQLQLESIRAELKTFQIDNEQLQRDKASFELEIKSLNQENQDLKRQMDYNQKIMDSLSQELVIEKNDKFKIEESLKSLKSENLVLRRQLRSLQNRKIALERKLDATQEETTSLENRLLEMDTFLKEKMLQIDNLKKQLEIKPVGGEPLAAEKKESIELPPIVVKPQPVEEAQVSQPPASLTGKILAINKENNFVVIDLGMDSGIQKGDSLKVYRQGNAIAEIEVTQVRKEISACDIKRETVPIKVGDTVR